MKSKLVKHALGYILFDEKGIPIGTTPNVLSNGTFSKLSLKNCQAIELGYDLDELAELSLRRIDGEPVNDFFQQIFKLGFQKALELVGDKKFSEEDLKQSMWDLGDALYNNCQNGIKEGEPEKYIKSIIQSLQQTEWDVEIEMEIYDDPDFVKDLNKEMRLTPKILHKPKLDKDGCLILKRRI